MTKYKLFILVNLLFGAMSMTSAQDVWSLPRCIDYAQKNSIQIKQNQINVRNAQINEQEAKMSRFPTLDLGSNLGSNFGRGIDPSQNTFINQTTGFNSFSLNLGGILYNGNRINNNIKQSAYDVKANEASLEQIANDIALNVAAAYLQVLLNEEQASNMQKSLEQQQQQLAQTEKLINAGARPQNDRYDILAQVAKSEQNVVTAQNNVDIAYLNLKQLMLLDPDYNLKIEKPNISALVENEITNLGLTSVYNRAVGFLPQIKAAEFRLKSAEIGVDLAKSQKLPRVSYFGGMSSQYSTKGVNQVKTIISIPPKTFNVLLDNKPATLVYPSTKETVIDVVNAPYFNQINNNFGQQLGVSIAYPLWNNRAADFAMERARLNVQNVQYQNLQQQQQLKTDIQNALANAKAAKKQYDAAVKAYDASKIAFENAERRYKIGAGNAFEYTTARNNMDSAAISVTTSKYDYIFKLKIVDFYQGKKIVIN